MVKNKVNDMFEQQQDTGKSASLAEKYANMRDQMSTMVERLGLAERALEAERASCQQLLDEMARRVAAAEERARLKAEAGLEERKKAVDAREQGLDRREQGLNSREHGLDSRERGLDSREAEIVKAADTIAQDIESQVNKSISELRARAEKTALTRLADMFEAFLQASLAVMDKDSSKRSGVASQISAGRRRDAISSEG